MPDLTKYMKLKKQKTFVILNVLYILNYMLGKRKLDAYHKLGNNALQYDDNLKSSLGRINNQLFETGSVTPNDDNKKDKIDNDNQKTPQIQLQLTHIKRDHLSTITLIYVLRLLMQVVTHFNYQFQCESRKAAKVFENVFVLFI